MTMKRVREFRDQEHRAAEVYCNLCELYDGLNTALIKTKLNHLIERDPYFLDSYVLLCEILLAEGNMQAVEAAVEVAFKRAVELIADEHGRWPEVMRWEYPENRHIIRAIFNKAISLWRGGRGEGALALFRKLLRMDPEDNVGARFYILALRMGMTFQEFGRRFYSKEGEIFNVKLGDWFVQNYTQFPEDFEWWERALEEER